MLMAKTPLAKYVRVFPIDVPTYALPAHLLHVSTDTQAQHARVIASSCTTLYTHKLAEISPTTCMVSMFVSLWGGGGGLGSVEQSKLYVGQ